MYFVKDTYLFLSPMSGSSASEFPDVPLPKPDFKDLPVGANVAIVFKVSFFRKHWYHVDSNL